MISEFMQKLLKIKEWLYICKLLSMLHKRIFIDFEGDTIKCRKVTVELSNTLYFILSHIPIKKTS